MPYKRVYGARLYGGLNEHVYVVVRVNGMSVTDVEESCKTCLHFSSPYMCTRCYSPSMLSLIAPGEERLLFTTLYPGKPMRCVHREPVMVQPVDDWLFEEDRDID